MTIGPVVLKSIAPIIHEYDGKVDCHLMVSDPGKHIPEIAQAGGDSVTFHYEAVYDPSTVAVVAREHGLQVGLAFNPESNPEDVVRAAAGFDLILCMSIHPGYSGQEFMPGAIDRISKLRGLVPADVFLQVDGGLGPDNVGQLYQAGADLLVAGTAIFDREDLPRAYRRLVQALA